MRKIELLCPASSLEVLKIAVIYGADAVYISDAYRRWNYGVNKAIVTGVEYI